MMRVLSSPHNHTVFVDGRNTAEEMARTAFEKGFVALGFSEHGLQDFDCEYALNRETERAYIAEINRLKADYAGRMKIVLGIERDHYALADREKFDYVIGSQHYLGPAHARIAVDSTADNVRHLIQAHYADDPYKMTADYYDRFAQYIEAYRPDIIAHFDLVRKLNADGRFFDETSPKYQKSALDALERMAGTGALLEINTGAIARGYQKTPYPSPFLLVRWRELGGRVILSGDCHDARYIDCAFEACVFMAAQAGFREIWGLDAGNALFAPIPLQ